MNYFIAPLSLMLALAALSFGQITIDSTQFPTLGTHISKGDVNDATFDVGSSGANQTWEFGSYTWDNVGQLALVSSSSTPHASSFPQANLAIDLGMDYYIYFQISSSANLGLGKALGDSLIIMSQPETVMTFPCTYLSNWTSVSRYQYNQGGFAYVEIDSAVYFADGWGTVITPYGSWPSLRVFIQWWHVTERDGVPVNSWQTIGYDWFNQQGIAKVEVWSHGSLDPNFSTGSMSMTDVPLAADPAHAPVANRFEIGQNYPNPFNPSTTISFALPVEEHVILKVYNIMGREVTTLLNERMTAGSHELNFDGSALPSGIYFYRLQAGGTAHTKKMVLLK